MNRLLPLLLVLAAGCRDDRVHSGEGEVRLAPAQLDLGEVYVGDVGVGALEVLNTGTTALELSWEVSDPAFALDAPPETLPGGSTVQVTVHASTSALGTASAEVSVTARTGTARSTVTVSAVDHPPCNPLRTCTTSTWNAATRACEEGPVPDGLSCSSLCLEAAKCIAGRCVGDEKNCDDHDACTTDVCHEPAGCEHVARPPCPGDGQCQVGVCNPASGCELAQAQDGKVCGRSGCSVADVCIAGACVERDPPDGFVCAEASPCQGEGHCSADVCVRPPATTLTPSWNFSGPLPDGGAPATVFSDLLLGPDGDLTLSSYFYSPPMLAARGPNPASLPTAARRCVYWENVMVCADHPATVAAGVTAIDPTTAGTKWTYGSVLADLPALVAADHHTFLARLVVLSSTRLGVVFETRRVLADGQDSLCRTFSVVVLDRFGAKVDAWTIIDPMFSRCVHPHSFGAASDTSGNLYLAFTPAVQTNPASPAIDDETLFVSYSPGGALRWKGTVLNLPGGELSVARGLLFQQHLVTAFNTADGTVAGVLPDEFHLGVATATTLIPGPLVGASKLAGFGSQSLTQTWGWAPAAGTFASDQVRLAGWTTRNDTRNVVLGFTRANAALALQGIEADTGRSAFECPLSLPFDPLLVEVGRGGMGVMTAYLPPADCILCDPRFAGTQNRFFWFDLPLIGRPSAVWSGPQGGPGHDHHED